MRNMSKKTWKLRVWNHMTEMQKLDILLKHAKVPHTYDPKYLGDYTEQIVVYNSEGHRMWDAICLRGTFSLPGSYYGADQGLIEVMGSRLVRSQRCGGVEMLRKIVDFTKKIFRMEPIPTTVNTMWEALRDLEVARNHFENCDPEFITAAIFELNAAESRLDAARGEAVLLSDLQVPILREGI